VQYGSRAHRSYHGDGERCTLKGVSSKLSVLQPNGIALFMCRFYSQKISKLIQVALSSVIFPYMDFHQRCSVVLALTCLPVIFVGSVILIRECK
jgi:hypothetical protein